MTFRKKLVATVFALLLVASIGCVGVADETTEPADYAAETTTEGSTTTTGTGETERSDPATPVSDEQAVAPDASRISDSTDVSPGGTDDATDAREADERGEDAIDDARDVQDDASTQPDAQRVESGTTVESVVGPGEEEWYALNLADGEALTAIFHSELDAGGSADVSVRDPDGAVADSVRIEAFPEPHAVGTTAERDGTHYVRVAAEGAEVSYGLSFEVSGASVDPNEPNDDTASATPLAPGDSVEGVIVGDDVDWFAVEATAGEGIELGLVAEDIAIGRDVEMTLFDADGEDVGVLPTDNPHRGAYRTDATLPADSVVGAGVAEETGTYYVRVSGVSGTIHGDGTVQGFTTYALAVETVALDAFDPNERQEIATRLASGETIEAVLAGYDRDWYAFDAEEGDEIAVEYEFVDATDVLLGTERQLRAPTGEVVVVPGNAPGTMTAPVSGTYYVYVAPDDDTTSGDLLAKETYRLTVTVDDGEPAPADRTSVTFTDQTSDGSSVVIDEAALASGGFVAVHDATGAVIGASAFLDAGIHRTVGIDLALAETQVLVAVAHADTNENGAFDFVDSEGREDGPYLDDRGEPIVDGACVSVE